MSTAQKTEVRPDSRPHVAGYPLPWMITEPDQNGGQAIVDADGREVIADADPDDMYAVLVPYLNCLTKDALMAGLLPETVHVMTKDDEREIQKMLEALARIMALEGALIRIAGIYFEATNRACNNDDPLVAGTAAIQAILFKLGLAHRLEGNPAEAEEAVASHCRETAPSGE